MAVVHVPLAKRRIDLFHLQHLYDIGPAKSWMSWDDLAIPKNKRTSSQKQGELVRTPRPANHPTSPPVGTSPVLRIIRSKGSAKSIDSQPDGRWPECHPFCTHYRDATRQKPGQPLLKYIYIYFFLIFIFLSSRGQKWTATARPVTGRRQEGNAPPVTSTRDVPGAPLRALVLCLKAVRRNSTQRCP